MNFEYIGYFRQSEIFACGCGIKEAPSFSKIHGIGNWRKRKGVASICLADGSLH